MEHKKCLLVFLDLEFTQPTRKIIDFGAVIADMDTKKVVDQFSSLVNPSERLTSEVEELTGINDSMLARAPTFMNVWASFLEFLGQHGLKKAIFGSKSRRHLITWGAEDAAIIRSHLHTLKVQPQLPAEAVCDLQSAYSYALLSKKRNPQAALKDASRRFGLSSPSGSHRALADALLTCRIGMEYFSALKKVDLVGIE